MDDILSVRLFTEGHRRDTSIDTYYNDQSTPTVSTGTVLCDLLSSKMGGPLYFNVLMASSDSLEKSDPKV